MINFIQNQSDIFDHIKKVKNLVNLRTTTVDLYSFLDQQILAVKTIKDLTKINEFIHGAFIGYIVNVLLNYIPNFLYTFSYKHTDDNLILITEYIRGISFLDYIKSKKFNFRDYFWIMMQICLSLTIAQNEIGFVHMDLNPWNIIIREYDTPIEFVYVISPDKIIKIKTN